MKNDIFIGARSLGNEIELILPTYGILKQQIEDFRTNAANADANKNENIKQSERKQYNNTISIFGARGTGKTSAIYTLMDQLENEKEKKNIILPIIEPDNFGANTKILGSIIGFLGDEIKQILAKIKQCSDQKKFEGYFNNCILRENNKLNIAYNDLIEYYSYTEKQFQELLLRNSDDYETYFKKSSSLLKPDVALRLKIFEVLNELVFAVRKLENSNEPLIFIFIDDIDLKTQKCKELIESIMQYTNHPNVVTVLSGDNDILKESIALSLLSAENLHANNLSPYFKINDTDKLWERKNYLSIEYMKKIMPPAFRHSLIKWNLDTIPQFAFLIEGKNVTLCDELSNLFDNDESANFFSYKAAKGRNTSIEKLDIVNVPIKYAYCIFDDKPRGLVNTYYYIHNFKHSGQEKSDFMQVKSLIDTIVQSSTMLVEKQKLFFDKCLMWGKDENTTRLDYQCIKSEFLGVAFIESKQKSEIKESERITSIRRGLAFFFVCELLKQLLPNVQFLTNDYKDTKDWVFKFLISNEDFFGSVELNPNTDLLTEKNKKTPDNKKIDDCIYGITGLFEGINCKNSLLFYQYLLQFGYTSFDIYFKNEFSDRELVKKRIFLAASQLFVNDIQNSISPLLKDLFIYIHESKNLNLGKLIQIMQEYSSQSDEVSFTQKVYQSLLNEFNKKNNPNNYTELCTIRDNVNGAFNSARDFPDCGIPDAIIILLTNWLTCVRKGEYNQSGTIDKMRNIESLNKLYSRLGRITSDSKFKANERLINIINKVISVLENNIILSINEKVSGIFHSHFDNFNLPVIAINPIEAQKAFKKFTDSQSGYASQCKIVIDRVKQAFENGERINKLSLSQYLEAYGCVYRLANNNLIWYGYSEAIEFLAQLRSNYLLEPNEVDYYNSSKDIKNKNIPSISLVDLSPLLARIAEYRLKQDKGLSEELDFNELKEKIKPILSNSFKAAQEEYAKTLDEIGFTLDNMEELNGDTGESLDDAE